MLESLRTRLVLAFILAVILPVAGLGLILVISGNRSAQEEIDRQLSTIASFKTDAVEEWSATLKAVLGNALVGENTLSDARTVLTTDSAEQRLVIQSRGRLRTHLLRLVSASPYFYEYFVVNTLGEVILATNPGREGQIYSTQSFFQEGRKRPYVDAPFYSPGERNTYLFVAYPIYAESDQTTSNNRQTLIGVLVGRAKLDTLQHILNDPSGLRERGKTFLVSGDGSVMASSNPDETGQKVVGLLPVITNFAAQIESGVPAIAAYRNLEDIPVNSAYQSLSEPRSLLVVEQSQVDALRARLVTLAVNLSTTLASIAVALYIALAATRSIALPISELVEIATSVSTIGYSGKELADASAAQGAEGEHPGEAQSQALQAAAPSSAPILRSAAAELHARTLDWRDELGILAGTFNGMTLQLARLITGLEDIVAERTHQLERRTRYLQASADVSRAAASILDPEKLLEQAAELIRDRFDLYYVGIFIVDNERRYAILRAGTGEAGRILLERHHRLPIGGDDEYTSTSMIGWCIANAQPRIAQIASADQVRYATPELPQTRSEIALPLRARGLVIGALSVQSSLANAFDQASITVLQTLADQLAIAIHNALLFEQREQSLQAERRAYAQATRTEWQNLLQGGAKLTLRGDTRGVRLVPPASTGATQPGGGPQAAGEILQDGPGAAILDPSQTADGKATQVIPIQVRGVTIGYIRASKETPDGSSVGTGKPAGARVWNADEMAFLNSVTEQVGLALDSARLYAETRHLAEQERLVGEITARLRATLDMQTVLETAAQELRAALNLEEVQVRLGAASPAEGYPGATETDSHSSGNEADRERSA